MGENLYGLLGRSIYDGIWTWLPLCDHGYVLKYGGTHVLQKDKLIEESLNYSFNTRGYTLTFRVLSWLIVIDISWVAFGVLSEPW